MNEWNEGTDERLEVWGGEIVEGGQAQQTVIGSWYVLWGRS